MAERVRCIRGGGGLVMNEIYTVRCRRTHPDSIILMEIEGEWFADRFMDVRPMLVDKPRKLTKAKLLTIIEALTSRLAGEIESDIPREAYDEARLWAEQKYNGKRK